MAFEQQLSYNLSDSNRTMPCDLQLNVSRPSDCPPAGMVTTTAGTVLTGFEHPPGLQVVLMVYLLPVVIVAGVLGNGATLVTIRRSPLMKYSVSVYVAAYCVVNMLSLIFNTAIFWLQLVLPNTPFWETSDATCRLWHFFIYMVDSFAIWFVVAMVIDRYVIVWYPSRRKQMCTRFIAKLVVIMISVGVVCITVHALWTYSLASNGCTIENPHDMQVVVWSWTHFVSISLLPILIIFIFGNLLCVRLCWKTQEKEVKSAEVTLATTIVCCFYFFLKFPFIGVNLIRNIAPKAWIEDHEISARLANCNQIATFMVGVAYSTLFPLFSIFCQEFRKSLRRSFSCCAKKNLHMECTAV